jgi:hypothetical protein
MATNILKDKIKNIVRDAVLKTDQNQPTSTNKPESPGFEMINSFPKLHDVLVDLLTEDYGLFISNILWVAPKPTTFRITLKNNLIIDFSPVTSIVSLLGFKNQQCGSVAEQSI